MFNGLLENVSALEHVYPDHAERTESSDVDGLKKL